MFISKIKALSRKIKILPKKIKVVAAILLLVLIISVGFNFFLVLSNINNQSSIIVVQGKYKLLSKRILVENFSDILINFLSLRSRLNEIAQPYGNDFALYFEYLPTGVSIGVNSSEQFYSASLFKLPVVMAYFRHKENNNITTDEKIKLTSSMLDSRYGNLWMAGAGYQIGLDEAAKLALTQSDNTAVNALGPSISSQDFDDVYNAIDIDLNLTSNGVILTTKSYASILKSLFFSALLTKDDSEKILSYLTESPFNDKLVAGVPANITVAHKIGVYEVGSDKVYSDCGIVYAPNRPYMLCMFSKSDEQTARERMKNISKVVYDYVTNASAPNQ